MTPSTDLIAVKVNHERQWAYALWLERMTPMQIRRAANASPDDGGLGYDLSVQAIRGLVEQARADNGDIVLGREERRERQLIEVDGLARAARADLNRLMAARERLDLEIQATPSGTDFAEPLAALIGARSGIAREVESAQRRLESAQVREAKLVGLDAPTEAQLTVTTRDGVLDDLNAALARLGEPTLNAPERQDHGTH
jgi:hypothetical protein